MDKEGLRVMRILIDRGREPGNDYTDTEIQIWFEEAGLGFAGVRGPVVIGSVPFGGRRTQSI